MSKPLAAYVETIVSPLFKYKTNYGINYAIHKEAFKDYHINGLHYSNSEKLATIPNGDVGGAGEAIDKVYNIAWTTKDEWLIKRNEVKSLYTS